MEDNHFDLIPKEDKVKLAQIAVDFKEKYPFLTFDDVNLMLREIISQMYISSESGQMSVTIPEGIKIINKDLSELIDKTVNCVIDSYENYNKKIN